MTRRSGQRQRGSRRLNQAVTAASAACRQRDSDGTRRWHCQTRCPAGTVTPQCPTGMAHPSVTWHCHTSVSGWHCHTPVSSWHCQTPVSPGTATSQCHLSPWGQSRAFSQHKDFTLQEKPQLQFCPSPWSLPSGTTGSSPHSSAPTSLLVPEHPSCQDSNTRLPHPTLGHCALCRAQHQLKLPPARPAQLGLPGRAAPSPILTLTTPGTHPVVTAHSQLIFKWHQLNLFCHSGTQFGFFAPELMMV